MAKPFALAGVAATLGLFLLALSIAGCGDSANSDSTSASPGLTITTVAVAESSSNPAASTSTPHDSVPATTGSSHTSITHATDEPVTATTAASSSTSTATTLAQPPVSTTLSEPPPAPSTLVIVKPTITLLPVNPWKRYEETDPFLHYEGPWEQHSDPEASGGGYKSAFSGGRVSLTFVGQRISLLCGVGPGDGIIRLKLDYQTVGLVDLYNYSFGFPAAVWTSDPLPNGAHVLQIEPSGVKNQQATGYAWQFDAVSIYGKLVEYTQD